ncbi:hypothetical protein BDY24DRAFT_32285 [Mrakia frigida]|uniref:uncharacterized protein n=1 Tax=Mrakia frigida TaxID=29902 RepID=UPI003FCBF975
MSSGLFVQPQPNEEWLRVTCGAVVLHECKQSEAMNFEGNNYYPHQSRQNTELFTPSPLRWTSPLAGRAAFSHMMKPGSNDLVRDVMWTVTDPTPGYEFLTLYVGYDMNKTFVSRFTPATQSSASTSRSTSTVSNVMVDGMSETPPSSSESESEAKKGGKRR